MCGNKERNRSYDVGEMMFGTGESFRYLECARCGCLQLLERLKNPAQYYPSRYMSFSEQQLMQFESPLKRFIKRKRDSAAVWGKGMLGKFLLTRFPSDALYGLSGMRVTVDSRILDVGAGLGVLLYSVCELGFKNILGIDPLLAKDIQHPNGVRILKKSIFEVDGKWDVIMFHHSFEHIPDPRRVLLQCSKLLAENGECLIRIPTVSSFAWKHYRTHWIQIDPPRHYFLHSTESMNVLATRAGFEVRNIRYDSTDFQFWGSEQIIRRISFESDRSYAVNPEASIFTKSEIMSFRRIARELNASNQGDQAAFYLRKIH